MANVSQYSKRLYYTVPFIRFTINAKPPSSCKDRGSRCAAHKGAASGRVDFLGTGRQSPRVASGQL